ncbi:alpha/beta hydrolase [Marinobacterium rhizophilum]|uniref:alpha/beta hydrolase n=1 Tax=Marinobacterium rhizophilum TaxID=420402 RepID=UPI00036E9977|nr:alpha/beta hydrolase [Marinobacterium rhizophilum]
MNTAALPPGYGILIPLARVLPGYRSQRLITILAALLIVGFALVPQQAEARSHHLPTECELDRGDLVIGPPDPGAPGPYTAARVEYSYGDSAANLTDFPYPVELRAEVTYPEELGCGPFAIIFIMHGGHATCITQDINGEPGHLGGGWPCEPVPQNQQAGFCDMLPADLCNPANPLFPNYKGYRYLTERLASQGFITVSISGNGINDAGVTNHDAWARLFQRHFGIWTAFSTTSTAPVGTLFVGRVDLNRVGVIGHSRGGAGAARLLDRIEEQGDPGGSLGSKGDGFKIRGALLIGPAPGDDDREQTITDTPLGIILPYCDGDQDTLPGVGYFDASRYAVPGDTANKHSFEVIGATHTGYNSLWDPEGSPFETVDDWIDQYGTDGPFCQPPGEMYSQRLTTEQHQGSLIAIAGAFFRTYLRQEPGWRGFLSGANPPPASAKTDGIYVGYQPKDDPENRLELNRFEFADETLVNTLGGNVSHDALLRYEHCDPLGNPPPDFGCIFHPPDFFDGGQVPHYLSDNGPTVSNLRIAWQYVRGGPTPYVLNELPAAFHDVSGYEALQFRAFVDMADPLNPATEPQDLQVVLHDSAGLSASVTVSDHSPALFYPPSVDSHAVSKTAVPRAIFNTVRVPLSAFNNIYLTDIEGVELVFDQTPAGAINIADMMFADEADNKVPVLDCSLAQSQLMSGGDKLIDVGLSVMVTDDKGAGLPTAISVYSDEDDTDSQMNQSSPDAKDIAAGTLRLRAERDSAEDGRVYLILAGATDSDGASGHACCTATVPNGNQPADIDSVDAQAQTALDQCTLFAAASDGLAEIPAGFFEVGDGPTIGNNQ